MQKSISALRTDYRQLSVPFWVLMTLSLVSMISLVIFTTQNQNSKSIEASVHLVRAVLSANERSLAIRAYDTGFWDQAVDNLVKKINLDWADDNIGTHLFDSANVTASFVLDAGNTPVYSSIDGKRSTHDPRKMFSGGLSLLLEKARSGDVSDEPEAASGYLRHKGMLYLASAIDMTTYFPKDGVEVNQATRTVLVLAIRMDSEFFGGVARDYLLPELHYQPGVGGKEPATWTLHAPDKSLLGHLAWSPELPGNQIIPTLMIGILLIFFLMAMTAFFFMRQTGKFTTELARARDSANLANKSKSEFLANMSHELRTPLNAIMGFSQVISDEMFGPVGDQKYRSCGSDINEAGEHLLEMINDILDISRIEAGQMALESDPVDFNEVTRSALRLVQNWAEQKKIKLKIDLHDGPSVISGDRRAIRQIILNLLTNAVKFTPEGGNINCETSVEDGSNLVFRVADDGIGIARDDLEKVMEPFGQTADMDSREHTGTGLGLPISQRLTTLLGGLFSLESKHDVGTRVTISIPLSNPSA